MHREAICPHCYVSTLHLRRHFKQCAHFPKDASDAYVNGLINSSSLLKHEWMSQKALTTLDIDQVLDNDKTPQEFRPFAYQLLMKFDHWVIDSRTNNPMDPLSIPSPRIDTARAR